MADTAGKAWVEKSLKRGLCRPKAQHFISQLTATQAAIYNTKLLFWLVIALRTLGKNNAQDCTDSIQKVLFGVAPSCSDSSKHIDLAGLNPSNLNKEWMQLIR